MKTYHLFSGPSYDYCGPQECYRGSFETLEQAQNHFTPDMCEQDWAEVLHTEPDGSLKLIYRFDLIWKTEAGEWKPVE